LTTDRVAVAVAHTPSDAGLYTITITVYGGIYTLPDKINECLSQLRTDPAVAGILRAEALVGAAAVV